jgi:3-methyladenine DNA glycosylase AlkD
VLEWIGGIACMKRESVTTMTLDQTMAELAARGSEATKRLLIKHGAKEPFFGVKVGDMKVIHKKLKAQQSLALELYATGTGDAQYLAGMIADGRKMTAAQIQSWADTAAWDMISGTIVPWVASEHPEGFALAKKWIDSPNQSVASSGWNTLAALAAITPDEQLPVKEYAALMDRVARTLSASPDRVRYTMNGFVIACGTYIAALGEKAIATARKIGVVRVDMGETECKVPDAESYILKSRRGAAVAPKRKTMRC